jgi:hypothetical protein
MCTEESGKDRGESTLSPHDLPPHQGHGPDRGIGQEEIEQGPEVGLGQENEGAKEHITPAHHAIPRDIQVAYLLIPQLVGMPQQVQVALGNPQYPVNSTRLPPTLHQDKVALPLPLQVLMNSSRLPPTLHQDKQARP